MATASPSRQLRNLSFGLYRIIIITDMNKIALFEAFAERLVEGGFARLFAGRPDSLDVARRLARAMEDHSRSGSDGHLYAPPYYTIRLHPDDFERLAAERQTLATEMADSITEFAAQAELMLSAPPVVRWVPDPNVGLYEVQVEAGWEAFSHSAENTTEETDSTNQMPASKSEDDTLTASLPTARPFLIVGGQRHIDLLQPVVAIGRALDNDIIIEDPRVSRHHAQLRRRYGRYVLYDIGSSGGTQINGYPIEECVLHSGDVVSFAGVQVIYGEDPPTPISSDSDDVRFREDTQTDV